MTGDEMLHDSYTGASSAQDDEEYRLLAERGLRPPGRPPVRTFNLGYVFKPFSREKFFYIGIWKIKNTQRCNRQAFLLCLKVSLNNSEDVMRLHR